MRDNDQELVQSCWEEISGEQSLDDVSTKVFDVLDKALEIKSKKKLEMQLEK